MTGFVKTRAWAKGANNIESRDRLPDGFVRHAVNIDPLPGGKLKLRTGYERVYTGANVRGVLALGGKLLVADGTSLVEIDTATNSSRVLRTIAGAGAFVGDVLNDRLYFCTANECLEYDGNIIRPWGVPTASNQPVVTATAAGGLTEGYYQIALTLVDAWGREGGADKPMVIYVEQDKALSIGVPTPPAGYSTNVYVGSVNGATLYLQNTLGTAATVSVGIVRDDTARCTTDMLRAPVPGSMVVTHNGVLAVAVGGLVQITKPMQAHLIDNVRGFLNYPADVNAMVSTGDALFVSADKCYALTNVETDGIAQRTVLEYPAIAGTAVLLPDGRGAWMTQYGQALTKGNDVELVNRDSFAPASAATGAAGVVDSDGNQLVVTSLKGKTGGNPLAASDFFIGEIINP